MVNVQELDFSYCLFNFDLYKLHYMPFLNERRVMYLNPFQYRHIRELTLFFKSSNLSTESHESLIGDFFFLQFIAKKTPYFLPVKSVRALSSYQSRTYSYVCIVRFSGDSAISFFTKYISFASERLSATDFGLYSHLISSESITFFFKSYPQFRLVSTHPVFLDWKNVLNISIKWTGSCSLLEIGSVLLLLKCKKRALNALRSKKHLYLKTSFSS